MAPHAEYIHEGTGRFGPKRQDFFVAPRVKKALHWDKKFSKGHWVKGWRPDRFLYAAFTKSKRAIRDSLNYGYKLALQKAGLV